MTPTDDLASRFPDRPAHREAGGDPSRVERLFAFAMAPSSAHRWREVAIVAAGLVLATAVVYATGGVKYAPVHLAYLPIIFAALVFEVRGGVIAALVAGLMLGPLMPIDTATGESQDLVNWLLRVAAFTIIGAFVGLGAAVLHRQVRQLAWLHEHDEGTGLLSHAGLITTLHTELTDTDLPRDPVVVVAQLTNYLDIQNAFGPAFASDLLHRICERGREVLPDEHPMALIQPDRLAVLLPGAGAEALRERLEATLREPYDVDGVLVYVDFSIGAAAFPTHAETPEELLQKASIAMHLAWKSQVPAVLYDSRTDVSSRDNLVLLGMVPAALVSDEFEIWHQAKIDLRSGRVAATEALLRWQHPNRGMIPPDMFVPYVEESPLIDDLTHWVIAEALGHKAGWDASGDALGVAINLSVRNLHDRTLVQVLLDTVAQHGIAPDEVDLEVTESAVMHDFDHCVALVARLRDHGFNVSIDDFGTGHSSLAYLKRLPVTSLKIDQAFVRNLAHDPADQTIARTIVELARSLGLRSIAEGVEDEESATILRELGCDYAQGYFFRRPCPNHELVDWVHAGAPLATGPAA